MLKLLPTLFIFGAVTNTFAGVGDPVIRILTVFTNEATPFLGNINLITEQQINKLNAIFANSGVRLNAMSAGIYTIPQSALNSGIQKVNEVGSILEQRDLRNADIVIVIINAPGTFSGQALGSPASPNTAFAVVADHQMGGFTYQHEFGHLLGAQHQDVGGVKDNYYGGGAYHGWYGRRNDYYENGIHYAKFCVHTIMANYPVNSLSGVNCTSTAIPYFSTPSPPIYYYFPDSPGYTPLVSAGDNTHNNAAALNRYGPAVASFKNTKLFSLSPLQKLLKILMVTE